MVPVPSTKVLKSAGIAIILVLYSLSGFAQPPSSILTAIKANDIEQVKAFLQNGANPNMTDGEGDPLLLNAVLYSSAQVIELLLQNGAKPNSINKDGETALMWAVHDIDMAKLLLKHGADPNAKAVSGNTALLISVVGANQYGITKLLLENGADPLAKNEKKETALMRAAIFGDTATLSLLAKAGNEIDAMDTTGATALINAIFNVNRAGTIWLLNNGADPDKVGVFGLTAVSGVVTLNDLPSVKAVLQHARKVNVADTLGISALMWAVYNEHDNPEIIQALIDRGADLNWKAKNGETALVWALRKGNTKTVALLKKHGAQ
ncbi:MAG TPA: ankyrin repeat domain-containing protein [Flavisolibacter sp.]